MATLESLQEAVETGNRDDAVQLTQQAIDDELPARDILDAMVSAMDDIGGRFQRGEAFVPEMLLAARAMKEAMALLEPILVAAGITPEAKAIIGTVQGDLHDIGKNLVAMMWKGANFEVIDLGTNVTPDKFVDAVKENDATLVGLSALLTTTMPAMQSTVEALRAANVDQMRVIVGGAPVTQEYADQIGADAYAPDAASAVEVARRFI